MGSNLGHFQGSYPESDSEFKFSKNVQVQIVAMRSKSALFLSDYYITVPLPFTSFKSEWYVQALH